MRLATLLLSVLQVSDVYAETCKYVDKDGHVTYSDVPIDNAHKASCMEPLPPIPAQSSKPASSGPQDSSRPPVQIQTQPKSIDDRRRVLEEELIREREALEKARASLAAQEAIRSGDERNYARVLERLKPFQDEVVSQEKKIEMIKQELTNLK